MQMLNICADVDKLFHFQGITAMSLSDTDEQRNQVTNSIVAYFCLNNNRDNWIIVIIHFPWLFPDHFSIPWLFQVFQKSGQSSNIEFRVWKLQFSYSKLEFSYPKLDLTAHSS